MADILDRPYECDANWKGPELASSGEWIYRLTDSDIAELEGALQNVKSRGLDIPAIGKQDFPLPTLSKKLAAISRELQSGRGFILMRGIPVDRYSQEDSRILYWGIMTYFGEAAAQNMMGELVSDVKAIDGDWNQNFNIRGYQTRVHLPFHCDKADLVGLMCLQTAKKGGESCISSSVAIHNEILRTRPDLLEALYQPFYIDHRGEGFDDEEPFYMAPVFALHNGHFYARFGQRYVETAQRFPQVPRLTPAQTEGMQLFSKLALSDDFRLDMVLERGDIQLLNNHLIVHSRTDYEDWPEPERRRHLLRMILLSGDDKDAPDFTRNLNAFIRRWGAEPRQSVLETAE
ncbi:MAG: TauD/TfdA family dioxygenase [Proteobacteria bacterium]|nr:TauD/TfdA family dioxygenase [Pseudomonadota bacterium]